MLLKKAKQEHKNARSPAATARPTANDNAVLIILVTGQLYFTVIKESPVPAGLLP